MSIDRADFETLLRRVLDAGPDALDADEAARFQHALLGDPDCRAAYLHAAAIHAALCLEHSPTASPLPAAPATSPRVGVIHRPHASPKRPAPSIPDTYVYAAAALVAIATVIVGIYLFAFNADPSDIEHRPSHIEHPPLATLIESSPGSTLTTPGGFISEGRDYPRGEYALDKGTAEFMLTNSVNVKLRGDTRMFMRNAMNVALTRGSAEFVVPTGAEGFTVHLPDRSRIVDLGTAFRVEIDDRGVAVLRVVEGRIAWYALEATTEAIEVNAGATIRIADGRAEPITTYAIEIVNASFEADRNPNREGLFSRGTLPRIGPLTGWVQLSGAPSHVAVGHANIAASHAHPERFESEAPAQVLTLINDATIANATDTPWSRLRPGDELTLTIAMGMREAIAALDWNERTYFALTEAASPTEASSIETVARTPLISSNPATGTQQGDGTLVDVSLSHTVTEADVARIGRVGVLLHGEGTGGPDQAFNQSFFDNVRLVVTSGQASEETKEPEQSENPASAATDRLHEPTEPEGPRSEKSPSPEKGHTL